MSERENMDLRSLIEQVNSILDQYNISDGQLTERMGNKYSKNTIINFRHGKSSNPNMDTFVDICNAAGIRISLDTEASLAAKMSGSIEEYRVMNADLRRENEGLSTDNQRLQAQISVLTEAVDRVTKTNSNLSDSLLKSVTRFDKLAEKYNVY